MCKINNIIVLTEGDASPFWERGNYRGPEVGMPDTEYQSNSPLLIAQVDYAQDEATGDFYYRTFAPGAAMAHYDGVYVVNLVSSHRLRHEVMLEADVLVINNICDADLLPVIRDRKSQGKLTVFELADDIEALPTDSPAWGFYQQSNNLLLIKRLANYCDALQFCSPELKRKYGYLNSRCCVFPNQVLVVPTERAPKPEGAVIVGWLNQSPAGPGKDFKLPHPMDNVQG